MPMREAITILSDRLVSKMVHKAYVGTIAIAVRRKWRRGYCKHKDSYRRTPHNASLFQSTVNVFLRELFPLRDRLSNRSEAS